MMQCGAFCASEFRERFETWKSLDGWQGPRDCWPALVVGGFGFRARPCEKYRERERERERESDPKKEEEEERERESQSEACLQ